MSISAVPDKDKDHMTKDADSESFVFKPHVETSSSYFQSVANKVMLCQFFFFWQLYIILALMQ